jgi:hypothetical protein
MRIKQTKTSDKKKKQQIPSTSQMGSEGEIAQNF